MKKCNRLLDYVTTYPDVIIRYHASDMQLNADSDVAYLVAPKGRSRIAGFIILEMNEIMKISLMSNTLYLLNANV